VLTEAVTKEIAIKQALGQKITEIRSSGDDPQDYELHMTSIQSTIDNYNNELDQIYAYNIKVRRMIAELEAIHGE
jgi:hypothetical protein